MLLNLRGTRYPAAPLAVVAIVAATVGAPARAQTTDELRTRLDAALKTIEDLQSRVRALESQRGVPTTAPPPAAGGAVAAAPADPPPAPVVAPGAAPEPGARSDEAPRVEFYGQAMVDAIYDFKRMGTDWQATMRPSQIPVTCPGSSGCGKDGTFLFSVRQSMLGVRGFIPTAVGTLKTDISFDLYDTDGGTGVHWQKVWGEIGAFGFGQTDSNFMDIDAFPNTIDYWGPSGMVFLRNPQLRYASRGDRALSWAVSLESPNSAIDTGKITAIDPSFGAGIQAHNRWPDLVGAVRTDGEWGHARAAVILRQVGYQTTTTPGGNPSGEKTGYGFNLSGAVNVLGRDRLSLALAAGNAIASYMNDGGADLAPEADLRAASVRSIGWLAYYNHTWADAWTSSLGFSEHRQDNTGGQLGSAFHSGRYASTNLLWSPSKNLLLGAEFVWGRLETKDGASATDHRLQFSTKASF